LVRREVLVTTSWDDGHPLDLKLTRMLRKYGLKGTFYVPVVYMHREVMDEKSLLKISDEFEVGSHTLTHASLTVISLVEARKEIHEGKRELEELIGRPTKMFAYPEGRYNAKIMELVKECGFIGARTVEFLKVRNPDCPYRMGVTLEVRPYTRVGFMRAAQILKCLMQERELRSFLLAQLGVIANSWEGLAAVLFNYVCRNGGVFHLWGHSWEIEQFNMWSSLNAFLRLVSQRKNVLHLCNSEVIERVLGQQESRPEQYS